MPIVFAAVTPHPPLLIPAIGKEKASLVRGTHDAFEKLEEELYIAKPHVIVVISPHGSMFADAFTMNGNSSFTATFKEFGDLVTTASWRGAPELAALVSHLAKAQGVAVQMISEEMLDHGASVPLFFLARHMPDVRVLPVGYSHASREDHLRFGSLLKEALLDANKRVAVIASGDLSHTDPGKAYDEALRSAMEKNDLNAILSIPEETISSADECGYRSILIALGMIRDMQTSFTTYCYESPVGVGYLAGNFRL